MGLKIPFQYGMAVVGALVWLGCGGSFDGRVYRKDELAFRLADTPSSWRSIDVSDALVAYRDDTLDATVAVNGRCGRDAEDVPLVSLTQHLFIYFTDRQIVSQATLTLDGREAMRTEVSAKLDGVEKGFLVYVLKKDGCVFDFLYISRPGTLASGARQFDSFVRGFRTLAGRSDADEQ